MKPLAKNIKRYFSLKEFTVVFLAVLISVTAGVGTYLYLKKDVVIIDNGKQTVVKTMKTTVAEVLNQNGIVVNREDYISVPVDTKLQRTKKNEIYIKRAVPVDVLIGGKAVKLMTYRNTIGDTLLHSNISMSKTDRLDGLTTDDKIIEGMTIKIISVKEEQVSEKISIPFETIKKENTNMNKGVEKVAREGKEGIREKLFKVVFEDGKEVARTLLSDSILANPMSKIIEFGTVMNHKTARGNIVRYSKVMDMRATAYSLSYADTGKRPGDKYYGITSTGMDLKNVKKGVIAVDPRVIPYGTRVYVEVSGSTPDYGFAIAADTGGAIKHDRIDLFYADRSISNGYGLKRVKVYILID